MNEKHLKLVEQMRIVAKSHTHYDQVKFNQQAERLSNSQGINGVNNLEHFHKLFKKHQGKLHAHNDVNSFIAYYTKITSVSPVGAFLPTRRAFARAGFPDIDTDLDDDNRHKAVQYLTRKYGSECVANIGTYGTLKLRAAITRVTKALDLADAFTRGPQAYKTQNVMKVNEILGTLPQGSNIKVYDDEGQQSSIKTISQAYKQFDDFRYYLDKYPELKTHAQKVQNLVSGYGVHAAGIVIADGPINRIAPVRLAKKTKDEDGNQSYSVSTQYDGPDVQSIGLIKMDLLGITTLSVIRQCCKLVKQSYGIQINWQDVPFDDYNTLALYRSGRLTGVFQCEGGGMQKTMMQVGVTQFQDIPSVLALYRPGPMESIPQYAARKNGHKKVQFFHPSLQKFLRPIYGDTYGVCVYQQQLMATCQSMAGFSQVQGYMMIKAVGKKKLDLMKKYEQQFVSGSKTNGVDETLARSFWQKFIIPFANYGFNKSHSFGYAVMSYQTAYLKANYTQQFFCALLNIWHLRKDFDKIQQIKKDLRNFNIKMDDKRFNKCGPYCQVVKKRDLSNKTDMSVISPSLLCKDVGLNAATQIRKHAPYADLRQVALKPDQSVVSSGVYNGLLQDGWFDGFIKIYNKDGKHKATRQDILAIINKYRQDAKKLTKKGISPLQQGIF